MSTSLSPQIGERFAGRYELTSPLREDGVVRAFLAFDHYAGLNVALLLIDSACAHPNAWGVFAQIVEMVAARKISGLVMPQGVESTPPVPPFCLAEPQALRGFDRLRDQGPMPWQRALTLGERAAEILHAAHTATGVAHRVLTPSRCAVTVRDDVRVLDFGVAELELGRPDRVGYRAPEQQQGGGDARSDVYTLALILFELISGQKAAGRTPPRLRSLIAVPRPVDELMAKALSPEPAHRIPDLGVMRAAIQELLSVAAAPVEPTPAGGPSLGFEPGNSPASTISAPSRMSGPTPETARARPAPAIGAVPAPATLASAPAPAGSAAPPAASSPAKGEAGPTRASPAIAPAMREHRMSSATDNLETLRHLSVAVAARTGSFPGVSPASVPVADRTEILPAEGSPPGISVADRTEILPRSSPPRISVADRTEVYPGVSPSKPTDAELTEVVRPDVAIAREEEKTAPRKPLRGSLTVLALARAKAGTAPAVATPLSAVSDDPPTEKIVEHVFPTDAALLLPSEPVRPGPRDGSPPASEVRPLLPEQIEATESRPVGAQPVSEDRPLPPADPDETTTVFIPVRTPSSQPLAEDLFRKALIGINVACALMLLILLLWLLIT